MTRSWRCRPTGRKSPARPSRSKSCTSGRRNISSSRSWASTSNQAFNLFLAGRAAMMLEGNWLVGQLRNANRLADYGLFPFPRSDRVSTGSGSTTTSARRAKIPTSPRNSLITWNRLRSSRRISAVFGGSVNKNVKSDSNEPLDLAWAKIFGQFKDVFVNGDQAFPLDVTTEYWRDHQRSRKRSPRSEGGRRRTAEIHRLPQIASSRWVGLPRRPAPFSLCDRNLAR